MKKMLLLLVELNVAIVIFSQVTIKPVAKTVSPVTTQTPITKSVTQQPKLVTSGTKVPAAWFRNDMDRNKVDLLWNHRQLAEWNGNFFSK
jgi:hypothetical protein